MKYIDKIITQTLEIKQSKFIAHLIPHAIYEKTLKELKLSHPKARHFVAAYRYLNEFNQVVEYSTDDGEPKGTSGKPTLMVLQGAGIINSAIIIVRYFGGTKLGTGGLVRAYSDATNLVLNEADLFLYKDEIIKTIIFDYKNIGKVEYECLICGIEILKKEFTQEAVFEIKATKENLGMLFKKLSRLLKIL